MTWSRRSYLQSAAAAGVVATAGCFNEGSGNGDGNGDGSGNGNGGGDDTFIWSTLASESSTYASVQAVASLVNDEVDDFQMEARPSEGTAANIGSLARGEADVVYTQSFDAARVTEGMEPYQDLDVELNEVVHWISSPFLFVTRHDWDSVTDIQPDTRVSPAEAGAGTRDMLVRALDYAVDDYETTSVRFTQQAGPFQEGTLDVGIVPLINGVIEGSYVQEQKSVVDLSVLGFPDEAIAEMEEDPLLTLTEVDLSQFGGYANVPEQPMKVPTANFNFVTTPDVNADAISETLNVMNDNRDSLGDYHNILTFHENLEHWVEDSYEPVPFHPAAADFYEEQGVWDLAKGGRADE
jgi:TRAP transporter TAXI family solute receptor